MSILESPAQALTPASATDEAAIAELHAAFEAQRAAFHTDR